jgi:hypothetical protein
MAKTKKEERSTGELIISDAPKSYMKEVKEYTHDEVLQMANIYYKSNLLPTHLNSPESAYIAMMWCIGLSLSPFLGLRDIFVIDNIPSIKTECAIALVESSGMSEDLQQFFTGTPYEDDYTAVCIVKRKGRKPHTSKFSVKDAKDALLWGKKFKSGAPTSWITYKSRMLMYRAVGFALRDIYPDVLRGAKIFQEVSDFSQYEEVTEQKDGSVKVIKNNTNNYKSSTTKMRDTMNELPPEDDEVEYSEVK